MKKISKIFFLTGIIISYILCAVSAFLLLRPEFSEPFVLLVLMLGGFFYTSFIWFLLWFKAWAAIQDRDVRMTPRRAVLFSLIPFFNFYWMFQLIWGFAKDYNAYIERHNIVSRKLPSVLFLSYVVLVLINAIFANVFAFFGFILLHISFISTLVIVWMVCDAINGIHTMHLPSFNMDSPSS